MTPFTPACDYGHNGQRLDFAGEGQASKCYARPLRGRQFSSFSEVVFARSELIPGVLFERRISAVPRQSR